MENLKMEQPELLTVFSLSQLVCPLGRYGANCEKDCSVNCKYHCSAVTGKCNGGCNPGYTGDNCETGCSSGTFGQDCEEQCHCKVGTCHYVTGMNCPQGCADGYTGDTCSIILEATTGTALIANTDEAIKSPQTDTHLPSLVSRTVALAVPLAIMCLLCIGLIIYNIVTKVRQMKAKLNETHEPIRRGEAAAYVNVQIDSNDMQMNQERNSSNAEQKTYEKLTHPASRDQNDEAQTYQELQM